MTFNDILDITLGKLFNFGEAWGLILTAFLLTAFITLAYKLMTDQRLMKSLKDEIKDLQKDMKNFKDNPEKMMQIQKVAMEKNMKYMMQSFKPMLITFIPLVLIYGWLRALFEANPKIIILGISMNWFIAYIVFSMIFSISLRKLFKLH